MKKLLNSLFVMAMAYLLCAVLSPMRAQFAPTTSPDFFTYSAINFTNGAVSTTNSYVIVSALGNGGTPAITYLDETSDLVTHAIRFYWTTNESAIGAGTSSGTNLVVSTNGWAAGDVAVIRFLSTDFYQRTVINSLTATSLLTECTISNKPARSASAAVGDIVYRCFVTGQFTNAAGRTTYNNTTGVAFGQANKPFLIDNTGTSLCFINHAAGRYIK